MAQIALEHLHFSTDAGKFGFVQVHPLLQVIRLGNVAGADRHSFQKQEKTRDKRWSPSSAETSIPDAFLFIGLSQDFFMPFFI